MMAAYFLIFYLAIVFDPNDPDVNNQQLRVE